MVVIALLGMSRAGRNPGGLPMILLLLLSPVAMIEEFIAASASSEKYLFFHGTLMFWPLFNAAILFILVYKMTRRKPLGLKLVLCFLPVILFAVAQLPILQSSFETKIRIFAEADYIGRQDKYVFTLTSLIYLAACVYLLSALRTLHDYHRHLAEHVAELERYSLKSLEGLLFFMVLVSVGAAALPWIELSQPYISFNVFRWQTLSHLVCIVLIGIYLIEVRYFAPAPHFSEKKMNKYGQQEMRDALFAADKAVVRTKAYKKLGVRLPQLAQAAKLEPELLASALKKELKINFRVFIFKYRLEYAKKLLLISHLSVADVAKSLGFKNQSYLADMFDRYMKIKLLEFKAIGREDDLVDWD